MCSDAPQYRFMCNIRNKIRGLFVDLNQEGKGTPPVIGFDLGDWEFNRNQHWEVLSVPNTDTRVLIRSLVTKEYIASDGNERNVKCSNVPWTDEDAQWYLEGGAWDTLREDTVVRFRHVKHSTSYLDLAGNAGILAPFVLWPGHGGVNQQFVIWKR